MVGKKLRLRFDAVDYHRREEDGYRCRMEERETFQRHRENGLHVFNDLPFYLNLCKEAKPGVVRFEISRVLCLTDTSRKVVTGFQVAYRSVSTGDRGGGVVVSARGEELEAPRRVRRGSFCNVRTMRADALEIDLEGGERLVDVVTRVVGGVTETVQFVTNERRVYFGGVGGVCGAGDRGGEDGDWIPSGEEDRLHRHAGTEVAVRGEAPPRRVVALVATTGSGVIHRIGHWLERTSWETLRPLILLRRLAETGRASHKDARTKEEAVTQLIVTEPIDELFRLVCQFITN